MRSSWFECASRRAPSSLSAMVKKRPASAPKRPASAPLAPSKTCVRCQAAVPQVQGYCKRCYGVAHPVEAAALRKRRHGEERTPRAPCKNGCLRDNVPVLSYKYGQCWKCWRHGFGEEARSAEEKRKERRQKRGEASLCKNGCEHFFQGAIVRKRAFEDGLCRTCLRAVASAPAEPPTRVVASGACTKESPRSPRKGMQRYSHYARHPRNYSIILQKFQYFCITLVK